MAMEFRLSYTANEVNRRLGDVDRKVDKEDYDDKVAELTDGIISKVNQIDYDAKVSELEGNINKKVDNDAYQTAIDILAAVDEGKVNQSDYDEKIAELTTSINSKVNQTDYDDKVAELNEGIGGKVNKTDYDDKVTELADDINSKVDTETYTTAINALTSNTAYAYCFCWNKPYTVIDGENVRMTIPEFDLLYGSVRTRISETTLQIPYVGENWALYNVLININTHEITVVLADNAIPTGCVQIGTYHGIFGISLRTIETHIDEPKPLVNILGSYSGKFIKIDDMAKTVTFPSDMLVVHNDGNGYVHIGGTDYQNEQVVSYSDINSTAISIYVDSVDGKVYAKQYNAYTPANYMLLMVIRTTTGMVSTNLPYTWNGKLYNTFDIDSDGDFLPSANYIKGIAHRGLSAVAPENTIAAFKAAKRAGFKYVECDVRFTSDGVPVLLHDTSVKTTSNYDGEDEGKIETLTLAEVKALDFGYSSKFGTLYEGEQIPTFEEFIVFCKDNGLHPYIELKAGITSAQVAELVNIVRYCSMIRNCTWISFYIAQLLAVIEVDKCARIGYVVENLALNDKILSSTPLSDNVITDINEKLCTGYNEVFIDTNKYTDDILNTLKTNGIPVEFWTLDDLSDIQNLPKCVSGVTSNILNASKIFDKINAEVSIISFTINGVSYQAKYGMTWEDWVNDTKYNTGGFTIDREYLITTSDGATIGDEEGMVTVLNDIKAGYAYTYDISFKINGTPYQSKYNWTWADWVKDGIYNTGAFTTGDEPYVYYNGVPFVKDGDEFVDINSKIIANKDYNVVGFINFTINDVPYRASDEMTWADWVVDTNYNTGDFVISNEVITTNDGTTVKDTAGNSVEASQNIILNHPYTYDISFYINDVPYNAEYEMTWEEWVVNENYNTSGFILNHEVITTSDGVEIKDEDGNTVINSNNIIENHAYTHDISFKIDNVPYNAKYDWTWADWVVDTNYNTGGFTTGDEPYIYRDGMPFIKDPDNHELIDINSKIEAGKNYMVNGG